MGNDIGSILMALAGTARDVRSRNAPGGTNDGRAGGSFRGREDALGPMAGNRPSSPVATPAQGGFNPHILANGPIQGADMAVANAMKNVPASGRMMPSGQDAAIAQAMANVPANGAPAAITQHDIPPPIATPPVPMARPTAPPADGISDDMLRQAMAQMMAGGGR